MGLHWYAELERAVSTFSVPGNFCIQYYAFIYNITVYVLFIAYVTLAPGICPIAVRNKYNNNSFSHEIRTARRHESH
jgi:hypothetical protein